MLDVKMYCMFYNCCLWDPKHKLYKMYHTLKSQAKCRLVFLEIMMKIEFMFKTSKKKVLSKNWFNFDYIIRKLA